MLKDRRSLDTLLHEAQTALVLLGPDAVVRDINAPALHLLGGSREDYVGREALSLVDPADWFFVQRKIETAGREGVRTLLLTIRLRRRDRSSDWHMLSVERLPWELESDLRLVRIEHVSLQSGRGGTSAGRSAPP